MNLYCLDCSQDCEEILPTYNCNYQKMKEVKESLCLLREAQENILIGLDGLLESIGEKESAITVEPKPSYTVAASAYKDMSFTDRNSIFQSSMSIGQMGNKIDNKLILVSLIVSMQLKLKTNNPSITLLDVIYKLVDPAVFPYDTDATYKEKLERLAILCGEFSYGVTEGNVFGLKNGIELKAKVNELLKELLPF